jgi:enamine deaminase RidA (YjgF/YER057c/UK114 family)
MVAHIWVGGKAERATDVSRRSPPERMSSDFHGEPVMSTNTLNGGAEQRLKELGIELPHPPSPLGAYVEAVQVGSLLFLSGTLPVEGGVPKFLGRIGGDLSVEDGRRATRLAALNALALVKEHLGSLDRVKRVVRLGVSLVTTAEFRQHPQVADAASELLVDVFGADKTSTRLVFGMASLPVGVCVVLESIFEIAD